MELINELRKMGFSEAEAKVYTTLLKYGKSTGYEISKYSGIARSKVYNHIEALVQRGVLELSHSGKTSYYRAIAPEDLVKLTKKSVDDTLKSFEYLASNIEQPEESDGIWQLENYNSLILKALDIVEAAEESLYIQIWVDELTEELEDAINLKLREIPRSVIILYDEKQEYKTRLERFYPHGFEMERLEDMSHRWITVVADDKNFLYSGVLFNKEVSGIYTENKILSFFAKEYVQHDAYCLSLIDRFRDQIVEEYGENMEGVRDIFK